MIPRTATRRLLRELSSPRALHLRSITTTRHSLLKAQQPPPPPPPPPPGSIPQSQQAAASAALQNLSHLSPAQITALLTAAPGPQQQHHQQPPSSPQTPQSLLSTRLRKVLWAVLFFGLGYQITEDQIYQIRLFMPFKQEPLDFSPEDAAGVREEATTQCLQEHPLLRGMVPTASTTPEGGLALRPTSWDMWEPYSDFPDHHKAKHLCAGTLNDPNALGLVHMVFRNRYTGEIVVAVMFGHSTTGWPGVVHGGMLSTIMDEAMGRVAALSFHANTAVTAKLQMDFKEPVTPGIPYVVRASKVVPELQKGTPDAEDKTDRKLYIHGRMEGPAGELVLESSGLFVVPKGVDVQPLGKKF